ncbi:hypothetical protein PF002_g18362 [Phytophthora fragariae]|uniref:Uncharacterized protein n=1 Tax=Phytophthora fragariae TaxID=53985 RepID=A0A6A3Y4G6_9STRA|nr:hypothetical protein PF002_g18362 [Phytophthora fragariae]
MQSFLGGLNYYSRFIEDFAIYASVLYELRESDFHEITRKKPTESVVEEANSDDREEAPAGEDRWTRAERAFTVLKTKIAATPVLRHFDPDRPSVVVVYASKWAVSAALIQEHDGVYWPVTFTSRTLKSNEINYGIVDKEVLALLRILEVCYTLLSKGFHGRLGRWTALLSPWTLEIVKCTKGEDEILGTLAATITPRANVDEALIEIAPQKQPQQVIAMPLPTVEPEEKLLVVSFDGSARVKRGGVAYSAIVWQLPQWKVVFAASEYMAELTVNEAEYRGMMLCLDPVAPLDRGRLIICGDSNLVIRQMRGEIECKAPGLKLLRSKAMEKLRSWPDHEFLHMKRDWNQSADKLAGAALQHGDGEVVTSEEDKLDLIALNRLDELLMPKSAYSIAHVAAVTRSIRRRRVSSGVLQEEIVQRTRCERMLQAQNEERWIVDLKAYLKGEVGNLPSDEAKNCAKLADDYEVVELDLLFYCPTTAQTDEDRDLVARLVVSETLQQYFLHLYHTSLEGGHQGIGRTYHHIRAHFHW